MIYTTSLKQIKNRKIFIEKYIDLCDEYKHAIFFDGGHGFGNEVAELKNNEYVVKRGDSEIDLKEK
jgi:hypothetical protein